MRVFALFSNVFLRFGVAVLGLSIGKALKPPSTGSGSSTAQVGVLRLATTSPPGAGTSAPGDAALFPGTPPATSSRARPRPVAQARAQPSPPRLDFRAWNASPHPPTPLPATPSASPRPATTSAASSTTASARRPAQPATPLPSRNSGIQKPIPGRPRPCRLGQQGEGRTRERPALAADPIGDATGDDRPPGAETSAPGDAALFSWKRHRRRPPTRVLGPSPGLARNRRRLAPTFRPLFQERPSPAYRRAHSQTYIPPYSPNAFLRFYGCVLGLFIGKPIEPPSTGSGSSTAQVGVLRPATTSPPTPSATASATTVRQVLQRPRQATPPFFLGTRHRRRPPARFLDLVPRLAGNRRRLAWTFGPGTPRRILPRRYRLPRPPHPRRRPRPRRLGQQGEGRTRERPALDADPTGDATGDDRPARCGKVRARRRRPFFLETPPATSSRALPRPVAQARGQPSPPRLDFRAWNASPHPPTPLPATSSASPLPATTSAASSTTASASTPNATGYASLVQESRNPKPNS